MSNAPLRRLLGLQCPPRISRAWFGPHTDVVLIVVLLIPFLVFCRLACIVQTYHDHVSIISQNVPVARIVCDVFLNCIPVMSMYYRVDMWETAWTSVMRLSSESNQSQGRY